VLAYAAVQNDEPAPAAPELAAELRRLYGSETPWSDEHEAAVRVAIATQAIRIRRQRYKTWLTWAAGAAAALLVATMLMPEVRTGHTPRAVAPNAAPPAAAVPTGGARTAVVAQNGAGSAALAPASAEPQILDAYRVARALARGGVPDARWDRDGDGRVDRADVDLIAFASVKLTPGGMP
jgi:hypothetical protein